MRQSLSRPRFFAQVFRFASPRRVVGTLLLLIAARAVTAQPRPADAKERDIPYGIYRSVDTEYPYENVLHLSLWRERGEFRANLVCRLPCLPNRKKKYSYAPEEYRAQSIQKAEKDRWRIDFRPYHRMTGKTVSGPTLTLGLDLRGKTVLAEFDGYTRQMARQNLYDFGYEHMRSGMAPQPLLFYGDSARGREYLLSLASLPQTALILMGGDKKAAIATLIPDDWRHSLAKTDDPLRTYVPLTARLTGDRNAEYRSLTLITQRTPVTDLELRLRPQKGPPVLFRQANDSNTHWFRGCDGKRCLWAVYSMDMPTERGLPVGSVAFLTIDDSGSAAQILAYHIEKKTFRQWRGAPLFSGGDQAVDGPCHLRNATGTVTLMPWLPNNEN